jgi:hypothetical protein
MSPCNEQRVSVNGGKAVLDLEKMENGSFKALLEFIIEFG